MRVYRTTCIIKCDGSEWAAGVVIDPQALGPYFADQLRKGHVVAEDSEPAPIATSAAPPTSAMGAEVGDAIVDALAASERLSEAADEESTPKAEGRKGWRRGGR